MIATLLLLATIGAQQTFPKPVGRINDFANILDGETRQQLEELARVVEDETTAEIAVATVTSLDGMSVEEYANRLFAEWGIGRERTDNGVLILVAPNEREMRIEVGYGLEPILPDGLAGSIIRSEFLPRFKEGNYPRGILAGVERIAEVVRRNQPLTEEERRQLDEGDEVPLWVIIPFLSAFVAPGMFGVGIGLRTKTIFPLLWGGLFGGLPLIFIVLPGAGGALAFLIPLGIFMAVWGYRKGDSPSWKSSLRGAGAGGHSWVMGANSSSSSSSGSSWSSSSSSSSSSRSFSGGSSGGGGASGSW